MLKKKLWKNTTTLTLLRHYATISSKNFDVKVSHELTVKRISICHFTAKTGTKLQHF